MAKNASSGREAANRGLKLNGRGMSHKWHVIGNVASELGFVGRVVRGRKRKRWLAEVLKLAGEQVNFLDAVED